MNLNKYTEKAQEAIVTAQQIAERAGNPEITPEHLLLALLQQPDGIVPAVLGKMNVDVAQTAAATQALLDRLPRAQGGATPSLSARLRTVTTAAEQMAERLKDEFTSTKHLLLAIASESGRSPAADLLKRQHGRTHAGAGRRAGHAPDHAGGFVLDDDAAASGNDVDGARGAVDAHAGENQREVP